jgi:iron(III) transport system permease protein
VHEFVGRKKFEWLLLLPLGMPGFVAAMAYVDALSHLIPLYVWVREHWGVEAFQALQRAVPWIFSVVVLASTLFPYVFLSCRAVFTREAAGSLEAARMLGSGKWRTLREVALPLARPALVAGGSLVAMETVNDYGVVTYFGLSPLTPGIFRAWTEGYPTESMRLALILMGIVLLGLGWEHWQRGRRKFVADTAERPLSRTQLNAKETVAVWGLCLFPWLLGFLIPVLSLLRWAFQSWDSFHWAQSVPALKHSVLLALGAAFLIVLASALIVGGHRAYRHASLFTAQRIGLLGYTFPSALLAVGVGAVVSALASFSLIPGLASLALSASVFGLMMGYFVRFLAVGIQPTVAGFERVPVVLHEAGRSLGLKPTEAFLRVDFPLVKTALSVGLILAFVDVFKELTLTLVLRPFDFETLATRIFRLTDAGRIPEAALPALLMVGISVLGLIPLNWMLRRVSAVQTRV